MRKILVVVGLVSAAVLAPSQPADAGFTPRRWSLVVEKAAVTPAFTG